MSLNKSNIDYVAKSGELINRPGYTLNLVTGCKHGCEYCYARKLVCEGRLKGHASYPYGFEPTFHPERVKAYGGKPKLIFLNNMGDVGGDWDWFHKKQLCSGVPTICTSKMMAEVMVQFANLNPDHIILLLTKRPEWYKLVEWPGNVWCGFSATNNEELERIWFNTLPDAKVPANRTWGSLEPWLDDDAPHIRAENEAWWAIGGLSGPQSQSVSEKTLLWLMDQDVQAKRFTKLNAISFPESITCFPREYPETWRVPGVDRMKPDYEKGNVTLYLGDARDILPEIGKVDTVLTDPPYNVGYKYDNLEDDLPETVYLDWLRDVFSLCDTRNLMWFWQGIRVANGEVLQVLPDGFRVHHLAAWYRKEFAGDICPKGHPVYCWEPIIWATGIHGTEYAGVNGGHQGRDCILGNSSRHDKDAKGHPCPKTESVVLTALSWIPGDVVLDPLMGSGTTGVAALKLNRKFIGIEIDEKYFEIAVNRIEKEANQMKLFNQEDELR